MSFTYDPDLGDVLSRTRAMLLDTNVAAPLFSDAAITNYHALFGVDGGTANLAVILMNRYSQQPTAATVTGLGGATWGDRFKAWQSVIDNARAGGVEGILPVDPAALPRDPLEQVEIIYRTDPYHPVSDPAAVPYPTRFSVPFVR